LQQRRVVNAGFYRLQASLNGDRNQVGLNAPDTQDKVYSVARRNGGRHQRIHLIKAGESGR
jgi:hypothetical protein